MGDKDAATESGGYQRRMSRHDIKDLEERARADGKRDVILSRLVDGQQEHDRTIRNIEQRLASGDQLIENFGNRLTVMDQEHKRNSKILAEHVVECERRKREQTRTNLVLQSKTEEKETKLGPLTQAVIVVVTNVITLAIIGGLYAYFQSQGGNGGQ